MNIKPQFSSSEVVFKISVKNQNSHSIVHENNKEDKENAQPTIPVQNIQQTSTTAQNEAVFGSIPGGIHPHTTQNNRNETNSSGNLSNIATQRVQVCSLFLKMNFKFFSN